MTFQRKPGEAVKPVVLLLWCFPYYVMKDPGVSQSKHKCDRYFYQKNSRHVFVCLPQRCRDDFLIHIWRSKMACMISLCIGNKLSNILTQKDFHSWYIEGKESLKTEFFYTHILLQEKLRKEAEIKWGFHFSSPFCYIFSQRFPSTFLLIN